MENWIKDVKYILMPARHPKKGLENEYEAAYSIWRDAWEKFREEIGVNAPLNSDGFVLPDEIGAVFYKNECVGFAAFTFGKMNLGSTSQLSWFNAWTNEAMKNLGSISNNVVICSQFTVNPKFAGKGHVVRWKEIVSLYTMMRFEASDAGVMAGHLNLTRGMQNASGEVFGATVLNPCHVFSYYGIDIPAQLVAYERDKIELMKDKKGLHGLCENLWSKLENHSDHDVLTNNSPVKIAA